MSSSDPFNDPALCRKVLEAVRSEIHGRLRFMEVCGTHTVSIFRSGISSLLPEDVIHISGPGCPVCVTHESEVAAYLEAARNKNVIIATFGDLMRVPGPKGANLKSIQAEGGSISIVYSPFDSLALAAQNPDKEVVFLGIGFETTAPTVAATILGARKQGLRNFSVLPMHKLVPPAMRALLADEDVPALDAFLLPGHVSTIIGMEPYRFLAEEHGLTGVIAGFEALDILQALLIFIRRQESGQAGIINNYKRAVADNGNPKAREIMYQVYEPSDALWRGLGVIPESGLTLRPEFAGFNAFERLGIELPDVPPIPGCKCGEVLKGRMRPDQCPLFGKACTPASPVGPCMVSTEGSCAAYYKYKV